MSFSVEMRNPFLDYRLIQCGLALEPRDFLQRGLSKWVLREAMRNVLPATILDRADKQGFASDEPSWTRQGKLGSEMELVFRSETFSARPYFRPKELLAMLSAQRSNREFTFDLWRVYIIERWLRLFIDPRVLRPTVTRSPAVSARDHVTRREEGRISTVSPRSG